LSPGFVISTAPPPSAAPPSRSVRLESLFTEVFPEEVRKVRVQELAGWIQLAPESQEVAEARIKRFQV
jgi:hypothetical protein